MDTTIERFDSTDLKTVTQLSTFLKDRGISVANANKATLEEMVEAALEHKIPLDPDGLLEDRESVIHDKHLPDGVCLSSPETMACDLDLTPLSRPSI